MTQVATSPSAEAWTDVAPECAIALTELALVHGFGGALGRLSDVQS
jgi:hypothetical protein